MKLDQLKNEIAELEAQAQQTKAPATGSVPDDSPDSIADDDPELEAWGFKNGKPVERSKDDLMHLVLPVMGITSIKEAKRSLYRDRLKRKLYAVIADETRPMDQRLDAANQAIALGLSEKGTAEEIVERATPHPHREKLKELRDYIYDPSQRTEMQPWEPRIEACREFRRLKAEFPKRDAGCCVTPDAEQWVAYWYARNDPEHWKSRDSYARIIEAVQKVA